MITLEIVFENKSQLLEFMAWLDGSGEQHYFTEIEDNAVDTFEYDYHHARIITSTRNTQLAPEG